jgi:hypothetical protein
MELPPRDDAQDASFDSVYSAMARWVPALRRPPKSVLGSLHVVESYFGAELSADMVDVANNLSARQLQKLETEIEQEQDQTEDALSLENRPRQKPEFETYHWWKRDRRDPFARSNEEFFRKLYDKFSWTKRPHIAGAGEISVHEAVLPTAARDIHEASVLKHLALYSEHTAVRDPLERLPYVAYGQGAAPSLETRRGHLANGLRQLLPIAPLVRDGTFILVGREGQGRGVFDVNPDKTDPFLWWILGRCQPDMQQEIAQLYNQRAQLDPRAAVAHSNIHDRLNGLHAEAQTVVRRHYPYAVSDEAWGQLMTMVGWTSRYSLAPVTADPLIMYHMTQGSRIALGGLPGLYSSAAHPSPQSAAISYQVPSLWDCSFPNIVRLRRSNLFEKVRKGLVEVAIACAESNPESYDAYQQAVARCAQDIVGPLYRELEARRRRDRLASLGITAVSEVVELGINGIAGKLAGGAIDRLGGRTPKRRLEESKTACSIIRSLLLYKSE